MIMSIEYPCVYWSDGLCKKFSDDKSISYCVEGPCGDQMPSNADRIRSMNDEELANLLTDFSNNGGWVTEIGREVCYKRITDWLQQPAEEGER